MSFFKKKYSSQYQTFASTIIVILDWTPNTNHIGLYVAKHQKFFERENLDVKIVHAPQTSGIQAVASNSAQFAVSFTSNVYQARNRNIPIKSVAAILQKNTSCFAWRWPTAIKTPKDFENKRYGSWGSPEEEATLKYLVEQAKGDFKKVKIVSTGVMDFLDATPQHADFMWIYMGWEGIRAKLANVKISYLCPKDLDPAFDTHSPLIVTSEKLLHTQPLLVQGFLRALTKGYELAIQTPELAANDLLSEVPELDANLVKASAKFLSPEFKRSSHTWGEQSTKAWAKYGTWLLKQKLIEKLEPPTNYFTNDFLVLKKKQND